MNFNVAFMECWLDGPILHRCRRGAFIKSTDPFPAEKTSPQRAGQQGHLIGRAGHQLSEVESDPLRGGLAGKEPV